MLYNNSSVDHKKPAFIHSVIYRGVFSSLTFIIFNIIFLTLQSFLKKSSTKDINSLWKTYIHTYFLKIYFLK